MMHFFENMEIATDLEQVPADLYHFPPEDRAAQAAETAYRMFRQFADIHPDDMTEYEEGERDAWAQVFGILARPDDPRLVEVLGWKG